MAVSIAKLAIHLTTDTSQMVAGFAKAKGMAAGFAGSMGGAGGGGLGSLLGMGASFGPQGAAIAAVAAGLAAAAAAASKLAVEGIRVNAALERAQAQFTAFIGDADKASELLGGFRSFAQSTTFGFEELAASGKTLLAMGSSAEQVQGQLFMLGELAAGSGSSVEDLAMLLGQVQTAGRLMTQDLNQFSGRGIGLLEELSRQFGVSGAEIRKMAEEGKIGYGDVVKALANMTTGTGNFAGQTEALAGTLAGKWDQLKDKVSQFAGTVMTMAMPVIKDIVDQLTFAVEQMDMWSRFFGSMAGYKFPEMPEPLTPEERAAEIQALAEAAKLQQEQADAIKAAKAEAEAMMAAQTKMQDDLKRRGEQLTNSLKDPAEKYADEIRNANELLDEGMITWETYSRAIQKAGGELDKLNETKKSMDKPVSNPAILRGSQAAFSAVNQHRDGIKSQLEAQKKSNELLKKANEQREQLLKKKGLQIREVTL